jgi:hypothetical protein
MKTSTEEQWRLRLRAMHRRAQAAESARRQAERQAVREGQRADAMARALRGRLTVLPCLNTTDNC